MLRTPLQRRSQLLQDPLAMSPCRLPSGHNVCVLFSSFLPYSFLPLDFVSLSLDYTWSTCTHTRTCSGTRSQCMSLPPFQHFSFLSLLENVATGFDRNEIQVGDLARESAGFHHSTCFFFLHQALPPAFYGFLFSFPQGSNKCFFSAKVLSFFFFPAKVIFQSTSNENTGREE